jgi:hypothetical protein
LGKQYPGKVGHPAARPGHARAFCPRRARSALSARRMIGKRERRRAKPGKTGGQINYCFHFLVFFLSFFLPP